MTPGELLDDLGMRWEQTTAPNYGYTGTFTPRCAFGHWTASAAGSDVSEDVLWARSYHCAVARSGLIRLGGWAVRQGHGGNGRSTPLRSAVTGTMTLAVLDAWQHSAQSDDTSSGPNQYGYGVALDNNGVGEPVPDEQLEAWAAAMATFCVLAGGTGTGSIIDHSASTARKVDLSSSPALPVAQWWNLVAHYIALLTTPGSRKRHKMYSYWQDERDQLWLSDQMTVRWLVSAWDAENTVAQLDSLGLPIDPMRVSRESIELGEIGVIIGDRPPW